MEDISTLIWIGIGIVWFLTRFIRRGVKKVVKTEQRQPRPSAGAAPHTGTPGTRIEQQSGHFGRGGKGPPPIVPR